MYGAIAEGDGTDMHVIASTKMSMEATIKSRSVIEDMLDQARINKLIECDSNIVSYDPQSFFIIFQQWHRRNLRMIAWPLLSILVWSCAWAAVFPPLGAWFPAIGDLRVHIVPLAGLIDPILTPVSFLLVFRIGRSAVRYWDARAATGKIVQICRTFV